MSAKENKKERVEFATKKEHFEKAFRLVYQEYRRKGYCPPNPFQIRVSIYNALPGTVTFCLWRHETLVGTASLVLDSPVGLPMEEVYPTEIGALRKEGRKLCEVSLLALNSEIISKGILPLYFAERLRCLYHIFKPIFWYARKTVGQTDLCIAVNPVHKVLYSSLYFEEFGGERVYQSVNGNPSIAMRLNFDRLEERSHKKTPGLHKLFLQNGLELQNISEIFHWNLDDFRYFFLENSDALTKLKPKQMDYLASLYPEFRLKRMFEQFNPHSAHGKISLGKCA